MLHYLIFYKQTKKVHGQMCKTNICNLNDKCNTKIVPLELLLQFILAQVKHNIKYRIEQKLVEEKNVDDIFCRNIQKLIWSLHVETLISSLLRVCPDSLTCHNIFSNRNRKFQDFRLRNGEKFLSIRM